MPAEHPAYIVNVHPCPACKCPVANIARLCHNCREPQPNVDYAGYERIAGRGRSSKEATAETAKPAAGQKKGDAVTTIGSAVKAMFVPKETPQSKSKRDESPMIQDSKRHFWNVR